MARSPDTERSARRAALTVVERALTGGAYADRALHSAASGLEPRDRALAKRLAFGAIQRRGSLDWVIERHVTRVLDPEVRAGLQLGLYQLLFTEIADHAAIGETVAVVKPHPGAGLVNAVLRTVQREGVEWPADADPAGAAIRHSHPEWLVRMWWDWLGADETRALLAAGNEPAELALRVNPLAGVDVELDGHREDDALIAAAGFDLYAHPLYLAGAITPQSRASQRVGRIVDPQPGERILDLCAAPGGKSCHLAALSGDRAEIVAVELNPRRADALSRQARRLHAGSVRVLCGDATDLDAVAAELGGKFDRVLCDPPCTGLGTLQRHPDLRWRVGPGDPPRLRLLQDRILDQGRRFLAPGGRLVYSVCTLAPAEEPPFAQSTRTFPHSDGTDGFYIGWQDE